MLEMVLWREVEIVELSQVMGIEEVRPDLPLRHLLRYVRSEIHGSRLSV